MMETQKKHSVRWIVAILALAGGVFLYAHTGALFSHSRTALDTSAAGASPAVRTGPALSFQSGPTVSLMIADTEPLREQGLSGHAPLRDDADRIEGMLFVFDAPGRPAFWMKDMLFPLDIIWLSADWRVADITSDLAPDTYPQSFAPKADVQYVLEVPAGFANQHGVMVGQQAAFFKDASISGNTKK